MKKPEGSLEGRFYQILKKKYNWVELDVLAGVEYIPRMLELLQTPLNKEESLSVLGMIGTRLHKFYELCEFETWEFADNVSLEALRSRYIEFFDDFIYRWPEYPSVVCDNSNNDFSDRDIHVDIWFRVNKNTKLHHIRLGKFKISCDIIDPYEGMRFKESC